MGKLILVLFISFLMNPLKAASQLNLRLQQAPIEKKATILRMPQKFYSPPLGYFCKKEVQLQQAVRLPVFIRVGSKEYVDGLERKGLRRNWELGIRD